MANWHDVGEAPPLAAGADLSTKQYYIVKQSAQTYVLSSAATDKHCGVLQNKPASGETCLVYNRGKVPVISVGVLAVGDWVTADAAGKAVATTSAADVIIGRALKIAAAGDITEIEMGEFVL